MLIVTRVAFTNVNGTRYRQGNQGFLLHDDVLTGCHGDEMLNTPNMYHRPHHLLWERQAHSLSGYRVRSALGGWAGTKGTDGAPAVPDEGRQQPAGLSSHPCVVLGPAPLRHPGQQDRIPAQDQGCFL